MSQCFDGKKGRSIFLLFEPNDALAFVVVERSVLYFRGVPRILEYIECERSWLVP